MQHEQQILCPWRRRRRGLDPTLLHTQQVPSISTDHASSSSSPQVPQHALKDPKQTNSHLVHLDAADQLQPKRHASDAPRPPMVRLRCPIHLPRCCRHLRPLCHPIARSHGQDDGCHAVDAVPAVACYSPILPALLANCCMARLLLLLPVRRIHCLLSLPFPLLTRLLQIYLR